MKKKIILSMLFALAMCCMTACGSSESKKEEVKETTEAVTEDDKKEDATTTEADIEDNTTEEVKEEDEFEGYECIVLTKDDKKIKVYYDTAVLEPSKNYNSESNQTWYGAGQDIMTNVTLHVSSYQSTEEYYQSVLDMANDQPLNQDYVTHPVEEEKYGDITLMVCNVDYKTRIIEMEKGNEDQYTMEELLMLPYTLEDKTSTTMFIQAAEGILLRYQHTLGDKETVLSAFKIVVE